MATVYANPLFRIDAIIEDGRPLLEAGGILAPLVAPSLKPINRMFREEKPIRSGDTVIFSTWAPPVPSRAFGRLVSAHVNAMLRRRVPDQASIAITKRCPNRCIHCGAADIVAEHELGLSEINRVVDESIAMGSYLISFDGGEPMIRKDLPGMVAHVDKELAIATCFTSGFGLTPERAAELRDAGLFAIRVSLDSPVEKEHDRVRGREGTFRDAMAAIKNAKDAGLLVDLFVVVSPHNIDDLDGFYELARTNGVQEISLYEIIAVGRWLSHEDEVISKNDVGRLLRFQEKVNREDDGPRVTAFPHFMGPSMFGCFAGRRWLHVTSAGDVLPCAYTPLTFGNVTEEPLTAIWQRMGKYAPYRKKAGYCLMRNPDFRGRYIKSIPEDAQLPYRVNV